MVGVLKNKNISHSILIFLLISWLIIKINQERKSIMKNAIKVSKNMSLDALAITLFMPLIEKLKDLTHDKGLKLELCEPIISIDCSPISTRLLTSSEKGTIRVWTLEQKNINVLYSLIQSEIDRQQPDVEYVDLPSSSLFSSSLLCTIRDHEPFRVINIKWSPSGNFFASGDSNGTIKIWTMHQEYSKGKKMRAFGEKDINIESWRVINSFSRVSFTDIVDIQWSQNERSLYVCCLDGSVLLLHLQKTSGDFTHQQIMSFSSWCGGMAIDHRESLCATFLSSVKKLVILKHEESGWVAASLHGAAFRECFATISQAKCSWDPTGQYLAVPYGWRGTLSFACLFVKGNIDCEPIRLRGHERDIHIAQFSPYLYSSKDLSNECSVYSVLVLCSVEGSISLWRLGGGVIRCLGIFVRMFDESRFATAVSWGCDGYTLLVSSNDGSVTAVRFSTEEFGCNDVIRLVGSFPKREPLPPPLPVIDALMEIASIAEETNVELKIQDSLTKNSQRGILSSAASTLSSNFAPLRALPKGGPPAALMEKVWKRIADDTKSTHILATIKRRISPEYMVPEIDPITARDMNSSDKKIQKENEVPSDIAYEENKGENPIRETISFLQNELVEASMNWSKQKKTAQLADVKRIGDAFDVSKAQVHLFEASTFQVFIMKDMAEYQPRSAAEWEKTSKMRVKKTIENENNVAMYVNNSGGRLAFVDKNSLTSAALEALHLEKSPTKNIEIKSGLKSLSEAPVTRPLPVDSNEQTKKKRKIVPTYENDEQERTPSPAVPIEVPTISISSANASSTLPREKLQSMVSPPVIPSLSAIELLSNITLEYSITKVSDKTISSKSIKGTLTCINVMYDESSIIHWIQGEVAVEGNQFWKISFEKNVEYVCGTHIDEDYFVVVLKKRISSHGVDPSYLLFIDGDLGTVLCPPVLVSGDVFACCGSKGRLTALFLPSVSKYDFLCLHEWQFNLTRKKKVRNEDLVGIHLVHKDYHKNFLPIHWVDKKNIEIRHNGSNIGITIKMKTGEWMTYHHELWVFEP